MVSSQKYKVRQKIVCFIKLMQTRCKGDELSVVKTQGTYRTFWTFAQYFRLVHFCARYQSMSFPLHRVCINLIKQTIFWGTLYFWLETIGP